METERDVIVSPANYSGGGAAPWSVSARGYGKFLTDIFDEWVISDVGKIFVQIFDLTLSAWAGVEPSVCAYRETCGRVQWRCLLLRPLCISRKQNREY